MIRKVICLPVLFLSAFLFGQTVTISVAEIEHFDPYFEESGTLIYDFLLRTTAAQPGLKLVERRAFDQVVEEQERQKNEGFMDGVTADQGKMLGALLLLSPLYDRDAGLLRLELRNLESGEISCVHTYALETYMANYELNDELWPLLETDVTGCLEPLQKSIPAQVAEVLEEKGGKARRLLCFTEDMGSLKKGDEITIFQIIRKKVGNKTVDYEASVGLVRIDEIENDNFFNVSVKDGGKEIVSLLAQNITLYAKS
ncbi:hypothetical protein [Neolewinella persica]|uniref:hypothetical protein n=1 Tax=Neolewinella persica TaxID=70998 RepID=UPI000364167E|nr:hypothetical protein [Neolewinella persica]